MNLFRDSVTPHIALLGGSSPERELGSLINTSAEENNVMFPPVNFPDDIEHVRVGFDDELPHRYDRFGDKTHDTGGSGIPIPGHSTDMHSSNDPVLAKVFQSKQWREFVWKVNSLYDALTSDDSGEDESLEPQDDGMNAEGDSGVDQQGSQFVTPLSMPKMPGNPKADLDVIDAANPRSKSTRIAMSRRRDSLHRLSRMHEDFQFNDPGAITRATDAMLAGYGTEDALHAADGGQLAPLDSVLDFTPANPMEGSLYADAIVAGMSEANAVRYARTGRTSGTVGYTPSTPREATAYGDAISRGMKPERAMKFARGEAEKYPNETPPPSDDDQPAGYGRQHATQMERSSRMNVAIADAAMILAKIENGQASVVEKLQWPNIPDEIKRGAMELLSGVAGSV